MSGKEIFNEVCLQLKRNDPAWQYFTWGDCSPFDTTTDRPIDDAHCIRFSQSLIGNTHLKSLRFNDGKRSFSGSGFHCSALGIEALINGIRQSKLKSIHLFGKCESFQGSIYDVMRQSKRVQELHLNNCETLNFDSLSNLFDNARECCTPLTSLTLDNCGIRMNADSFRAGTSHTLNESDLSKLALAVCGNDQSIRTLNLLSSRISDKAIECFVDLWEEDSPMEELCLSSNVLGPLGVEHLMEAAAIHPSFVKLNLSSNTSIGYHGIRIIGERLGNQHLVELDISNCVADSDRSWPSSLKVHAWLALAEGLCKNTTIEKLNWSGNGIAEAELQLFLRATRSRPVLLSLELTLSAICELNVIGKELGHAKLKELCLTSDWGRFEAGNQRDDWNEAFQNILSGLRANASIQTFKLSSGRWMGPLEAEMLMTALQNHPSMERLSLDKNESIGYAGLMMVGEHIPNTRLKSLSLCGCVAFSAVGHTSETTVTSFQASSALAEGLQNNATLQELHLRDNDFDSSGVFVLVRATTNHPSMAKLSLSMFGDISIRAIERIAQLLPSLRLNELNVSRWTNLHSDDKTESANNARRALLEGIKSSYYLSSLDIPHLGLKVELDFYLGLNTFGRKRLMVGQGLSLALWCHVLNKLNDKPSQLYYFLCEQPWLMPSSGSRRKRRVDDM